MNILYALVAFAVVMVVMTTLVVAVLEVINGMRGSRERYLRYMIGSVFDEYLWPQYGELLDPIEVVVTNPIQPVRGEKTEGIPEAVPIPKGWMVWLVRYLDVPRNFQAYSNARNDSSRGGEPEIFNWRNRPHPRWVLGGVAIWFAIVLFGLAQLPFIVLLSVILFLVLQIDRSREREREALPLLQELNDDKVARLHEINDLMKRLTEAHSDGDGSKESVEDLRKELLKRFAHDPETADRYGRIYYRRRFIDEVARLSRGMAAGGAGMQDRSQNNIGVLEFAEYLGSTHFGAAIRDVAVARNQSQDGETPEDAIKDQVREMARRYDALGRQATANYRRMTRRASVMLAFVVAFATNFDAFHVFAAFTRDTDLAQSVEQAYAARLEEMSRQESDWSAASPRFHRRHRTKERSPPPPRGDGRGHRGCSDPTETAAFSDGRNRRRTDGTRGPDWRPEVPVLRVRRD